MLAPVRAMLEVEAVVERGNIECLRETIEALRRGATRKVVKTSV